MPSFVLHNHPSSTPLVPVPSTGAPVGATPYSTVPSMFPFSGIPSGCVSLVIFTCKTAGGNPVRICIPGVDSGFTMLVAAGRS